MRREDRLALIGLILGLGSTLASTALPFAYPDAPLLWWRILYFLGVSIASFCLLFVIYDFLIRHRLNRDVKVVPLFMILSVVLLIDGGFALHTKYFKSATFSVSLVNSIIGGPYFAYKPDDGNVSFADALICIDITNKSNTIKRINDYYVQLSLGDDWVTLDRVLFSDKGEFLLVNKKAKTVYVIAFNQKTFDEQINRTNLNPGETITGIIMLKLPIGDASKYSETGKTKGIKLIIFDSLENREEHFIKLNPNKPKPKKPGGMGWVNNLGLTIKRKVDNLSILNNQ